MFYLANDERPERAQRYCFGCGSDDTPRAQDVCVACGESLAERRFLISVRWEEEGFANTVELFEKGLSHPGMVTPSDVFMQDGVLCSVYRWAGGTLMVDEGSPLSSREVLDLAQRSVGMLAYYHRHGVSLGEIRLANFMVEPGRVFRLFDPDVERMFIREVPQTYRGHEVAQLGSILRGFTAITQTNLIDLFVSAEEGGFSNPLAFGRALERVMAEHYPEEDGRVGAMTDVGLCRSLNEDNWGWTELSEGIALYVVADGMGGHDAGEVASEMAVENICLGAHERLETEVPSEPERLQNIMEESFRAANNAIKDHSERLGNDMGTTMVAVMVKDGKYALLANVGDSRGYLMRDQTLHQVTRDHSLVARMVDQNRITREEARTHPHSNILLRTVGTERDVDVDLFSVELESNDRLLLCSDGLWGEVEDTDIEAILNHYTDQRVACRELVRAAHHGGGKDNVTVVIVQV